MYSYSATPYWGWWSWPFIWYSRLSYLLFWVKMKSKLAVRSMLYVLDLLWWCLVLRSWIGQDLVVCWVCGWLVLLWSRRLRRCSWREQVKGLLFLRCDSFYLCWHLWLEWCCGWDWSFCCWLGFCGWRKRIMICDFEVGDLKSMESLEHARHRPPGF